MPQESPTEQTAIAHKSLETAETLLKEGIKICEHAAAIWLMQQAIKLIGEAGSRMPIAYELTQHAYQHVAKESRA